MSPYGVFIHLHTFGKKQNKNRQKNPTVLSCPTRWSLKTKRIALHILLISPPVHVDEE